MAAATHIIRHTGWNSAHIASSDITPSTPSTSEDPFSTAFTYTSQSCSSSSSVDSQQHSSKTTGSLNIFGKFPKDLSSFLSTGTISRRNDRSSQSTAQLGRSGYADSSESSTTEESRQSLDIFSLSTAMGEERPARKLKKENRFYNFLTRSRSRSKTESVPSRSKGSSSKTSQNNPVQSQPESKPPYRIPSRPLSSTTTTTNATITPGTPKARRNNPAMLMVPPSTSTEPTTASPHADTARPDSPNRPPNARKTLNFFGITISSPRRPSFASSRSRSRSRSRPGTPRISADIPPLPALAFEEDHPTSSRVHISRPPSRPGSPSSAIPRSEHHSPVPIGTLLHDDDTPVNGDHVSNSSKRKGIFSALAMQDPTRLSRQDIPSTSPPVSAPLKPGPPSNHRHSIKSAVKRAISPPTTRASSPPPKDIPRIVHTPATPMHAATIPATTKKSSTALGLNKSGKGHATKNYSLDTGYRFRATMDIVDEEGRLSGEVVQSGGVKGKGKERRVDNNNNPQSRTGASKISASVRSTRHGSFDFERPGWGTAVALYRTGSNGGTEGTVIRESALGPGLAGVGTLQRETSMKRAREREEKARELERRAARIEEELPELPHHHVNSSEPEDSQQPGHQTPPSAATSAKSSSMSKASGKKVQSVRTSSGRRAGGFSLQLGMLPFESPVSLSKSTTNSTSNPKDASTLQGGKEVQVSKNSKVLREEKERQKEKSFRRDRSPVPVPLPVGVGHRSGVKGRSLDLGLGLAWAPSKVREDALLPNATFFQRETSSSSARTSSDCRSPSSSAHGHGKHSREDTRSTTNGEKSKVGQEVADMFRKVLGEPRYARFKMYVHQFDLYEIPFDGPTGIIAKVDMLLGTVPTLGFEEKRRLMDDLVRIILQNA